MKFYQKFEKNNSWLKDYGCAFFASLYCADKWLGFSDLVNIPNNTWMNIYQDLGIFDIDGNIIWKRLERLFPQLIVEPKLWDGEHKEIKEYPAVVSVDGQEDDKEPDHFVVAEKKRNDIVWIYDPYDGATIDLEIRYGKGTIEESIFSIINFRMA